MAGDKLKCCVGGRLLNPDLADAPLRNISIYHLPQNPLDGHLWQEQVLTQVKIPINSEPVDLDQDGDLDIVAGSRGEAQLFTLVTSTKPT